MKFFCVSLQIIHFFVVVFTAYIFALYLEPIIYILGFLPLETGNTFWVYITLITCFCFVQFAFRGILQLLFSASMNLTTLMDIFSFLPSFILIAHITGHITEIPYIPSRLTPIVFLGIFFTAHFFLKIIVLFSSIYGKANSRWFSVFWMPVVLILIYVFFVGLIQWRNGLITHRFFQVKGPISVSDMKNTTFAYEVPEMSYLLYPMSFHGQKNCTWFLYPGNRIPSTSEIYIYFISPYKDIAPLIFSTSISPNQWTELCLPELSEDFSNGIMVWSTHRFHPVLMRYGFVPQLSLSSLEDVREFLFSERKEDIKLFKTIFVDGPYCSKEVSGEVIIRQQK